MRFIVLADPRYGIKQAAEERQKSCLKKGEETPLASSDANGIIHTKSTQQAAALVGASGASTERAPGFEQKGSDTVQRCFGRRESFQD